jgi:hypothetical protein
MLKKKEECIVKNNNLKFFNMPVLKKFHDFSMTFWEKIGIP